jgi:isopenicillin N synthase-like dioxygenase
MYSNLSPTDIVVQISRDEVARYGTAIPRLPQVFKDGWETITNFSSACDQACITMLKSLTNDGEEYHRHDEPSDTGLKIVRAPSCAKVIDVGENLHTDGGTLTLLFHKRWGLHAFIRDPGMWAFIQPVEGCAVINVGNALQRFLDSDSILQNTESHSHWMGWRSGTT